MQGQDRTPTAGNLAKATVITLDDVEAAAQALPAAPSTGTFPITKAGTLDLAAAVRTHRPSAVVLGDSERPESFNLTKARTAIILARPVKP